jgi:hypothetical protein
VLLTGTVIVLTGTVIVGCALLLVIVAGTGLLTGTVIVGCALLLVHERASMAWQQGQRMPK